MKKNSVAALSSFLCSFVVCHSLSAQMPIPGPATSTQTQVPITTTTTQPTSTITPSTTTVVSPTTPAYPGSSTIAPAAPPLPGTLPTVSPITPTNPGTSTIAPAAPPLPGTVPTTPAITPTNPGSSTIPPAAPPLNSSTAVKSTTTTTTTPTAVPGTTTVTPATSAVPGTATVTSPTPLPAPKIRYEQVLENWFGPFVGPESYPTDRAVTWFSKTPQNQRLMRDLFEVDMLKALKGEYNSWRETPRGRLALIILLDQVPRNIYLDKPQAFASDRMAQGLVIEGLQKGDDERLYPVERAFFYLPLMHSEDPQMQALSVAKYQELVNQTPNIIKPQIQEFLSYALIHQSVISKFGRFPYRNITYDRKSTPEELEYIRQWGSYPN